MIVDPFIIAFCLLSYLDGNKGILFIRPMNDDEYFSDLYTASGNDVILKARILYKLGINFRRILNLIEIVTRFRLPEDINSAVVVVV